MSRAATEKSAVGLALVFAVALAPGLGAAEAVAAPATTPLPGAKKIADATAGSPALAVQADSVSINVSNVPFRDVLARLAEQANIEVVLVADTIPNDAFSDAFENLPVAVALQRVLAGKSYLLRYAQDSSAATPRVAAVYIVPEGDGAKKPYQMVQVVKDAEAQPEIDKDTSLLIKALEAEKADERVAALKKYLDEAELPDYEGVAKALRDPDRRVREVALEGMENAHTLPVDATASVAVSDADAALRISALQILVGEIGGEARAAIEQALADPDPSVRANAQEMARLAVVKDQLKAEREAIQAQRATQTAQP